MKLKLEQGLPPETAHKIEPGAAPWLTRIGLGPVQTEARGPRAEPRAQSRSGASAGVGEGAPQGLQDQSAGVCGQQGRPGSNGLV